MYKPDTEKTRAVKRLMEFNLTLALVTEFALRRVDISHGKTKVIWQDEIENSGPFEREMRFNFKDPYELYMFDRFLIPRIQAHFHEATFWEVAKPAVLMPWSPEAVYAVNHGGVASQNLEQIKAILEAREAEKQRLRAEGVLTSRFSDPVYA